MRTKKPHRLQSNAAGPEQKRGRNKMNPFLNDLQILTSSIFINKQKLPNPSNFA